MRIRVGIGVLAVALLFGMPLQAGEIDRWVADDLPGADGSLVATWPSNIGRVIGDGIGGAARQPTLVHNAFGTHAGVRFDGGGATGNEGDFLRTPSTGTPELNNPLSTATDYSIKVVFRANSGGADIPGSTQWWGKSGIVDSGEGGPNEEYGLAIGPSGALWAGHGGASDVTATGGSVVDSTGHVAVMTQTGGTVTLWIDGSNVQTRTGGSANPRRDNGLLTFGCLNDAIFGGFARCSNVDLAEVIFFDSALSQSEVLDVTTANAEMFSVAPEPTTMAFLAVGLGGVLVRRRRRI